MIGDRFNWSGLPYDVRRNILTYISTIEFHKIKGKAFYHPLFLEWFNAIPRNPDCFFDNNLVRQRFIERYKNKITKLMFDNVDTLKIWIPHVTNVKELTIENAKVVQTTIVFFEIISSLQNLTKLKLETYKLNNKDIKKISKNLTNITSLKLPNCCLWGNLTPIFSNQISRLRKLNIYGISLNDECQNAIAQNLTQVKSLCLGGSYMTKTGRRLIMQNLKLEKLYVFNFYELEFYDIRLLVEHQKHLYFLNLNFTGCDDTKIEVISKGLPTLKTLSLNFNEITSQGFNMICTGLSSLIRLYLSNNKISIISPSFHNMRNLTTLDLSNNPIGDKDIHNLASEKLTNLQNLILNACQITSIGVEIIAMNLKSLKIINLRNNPIGVPGVLMLTNHSIHLQTLTFNIEEIDSITSKTLCEKYKTDGRGEWTRK